MQLDAVGAIRTLRSFAESISGLPVLRVYWYDGTSTGPTPQHLALAHLPDVKLRLGFVNSVGEQKGVDSLIVTDLITLARNRAMMDAVLLSGDEDLRVGVQQAQELGVRVHLLGIEPSRGSQSLFLLQESDTTHEWSAADLTPFLSKRRREQTAPPSPPSTSGGGSDSARERLTTIARELADEIPLVELPPLVLAMRSEARVPRDLDARLLAKCRAWLHAALDARQKRYLREAFMRACEARLPSS